MSFDYKKLLFWLLTVISAIIIGITTTAVGHITGQVDAMSLRLTALELTVSALSETRNDNARRLQRIEDKLDVISLKQNFEK